MERYLSLSDYAIQIAEGRIRWKIKQKNDC